MRVVDFALERIVPGVAIALATAALVVSMGRNDPAAAPGVSPMAERLARLEEKLDTVSAKLNGLSARLPQSDQTGDSEPAGPAAKGKAEKGKDFRSIKPLSEDASWPVIARRLTSDLDLDNKQIDALDRSLEECARVLEALSKMGDKKRAETLARLARRRAYRSVERALSDEQKKLFARLARNPKIPGLGQWLIYNRPCGGCGTKKAKSQGKTGDKS